MTARGGGGGGGGDRIALLIVLLMIRGVEVVVVGCAVCDCINCCGDTTVRAVFVKIETPPPGDLMTGITPLGSGITAPRRIPIGINPA